MLGRDEPSLTKDELAALELFKSHRALLKMVPDCRYDDDNGTSSRVIDYSNIDFLLDQLVNPTANRPSRSAYYFAQGKMQRPTIVKKTNLKTHKVHDHKPGECRNTRHKGVEFKYTLKTSTTLLPPEPQYMYVFSNDAIGFIWDLNSCDLKKEKYVWATDAGTDINWLSPNPWPDGEPLPPLSSVEELRGINNKAVEEKKPTELTEMLVGLPQGPMNAVTAPLDTLDLRLRAWNAMLHTKEKFELEKNIPVAVIQSDNHQSLPPICRIYTAAEREKDLQVCRLNPREYYSEFLPKLSLFSSHNSYQNIYPKTDLLTYLAGVF